jgi:serine/threonine-protein kinase HipA
VLWGRTIGAVSLPDGERIASFEYDPEFQSSGIEVAPLMMPLSPRIYSFPALPWNTFHGLPGMLADSLPDRFGNALINAWLATQGRNPDTFDPVERLCYIGTRGMGALEFQPASGPNQQSTRIQVDALVKLASDILTHRENFAASFSGTDQARAMTDILKVGTSAGGARAKAVIAWNEATNEVRSEQVDAGAGFTYWLLKFDGVSGNKDKELEDPAGYGVIEYAYYLMARQAGIEINECRLFEEGGRKHFMTKRFDRTDTGAKLHMQSLCALSHYDFNQAGAYSYEQALQAIRALGLSKEAIEQQFRRMAFNVIARNQDDHVKNIAFLMDRNGGWKLSPAFDVTYSYNPSGEWTNAHQMTLNGKRDDFQLADFVAVGSNASMKRGRAEEIIQEVTLAVSRWPEFVSRAGVPTDVANKIAQTHRLRFV